MSEHFENELDRLLAGRLDGDLTPAESRRLQELLAADERMRREAAALDRVDRTVRACGARELDLGVDWSAFHADVMARLCQPTRDSVRRFPVHRIFSIAMPVAAAAAVLIALTVSWSGTRKGQPQTAQRAPQPVIQVAYNRPAEPASPASAGEIEVSYFRSAELELSTAASDAEKQGAPSLAVASGSKVAAPAAPVAAQEPFQL